jgi:serine/threonine-protein kinase
MEEEPPSLPGYALLGRIDAGGMGVVWRVRDLQFGRSLALKVMSARAALAAGRVERFIAEAQICGQLAHPYIVPVHSMGRLPDGRPYHTMKLVEGRTLAALLDEEPASAELRMKYVQIFDQVCQAVAFAHRKGIIHRDLKPENVMVGAHGEVQLMDWGLAKVLPGTEGNSEPDGMVIETEEDETARTRAGSVLGTVAYMPPEQARGQIAEIDRQSDVFSLGAILCKVLTGAPPYTGPDATSLMQKAGDADLDEALARLRDSGADPELVRLAERCLAPDKSARPADAGEVEAAVAAYLSGVEERLQQERLHRERAQIQAGEERRRRKLWFGLAAAVLAAIGLLAGGGLYVQGQRAQRQREASLALEQAESQLRAGDFAAARESLDRAADRLGSAAAGTEPYAQLQGSWQLVHDLEGIQLRRTTPTDDGLFDNARAQKEYEETFAAAGFDMFGGELHDVAEHIRCSLVMPSILEAIDNWALVCAYDMRFVPDRTDLYRQRRNRLLEVARAVDPDPTLRDRIRSPAIWDDRGQLAQLAARAPRTNLSPRLAALLAELLRWAGGDPEPLLRTYVRRHPDDFWLNFDLGKLIDQAKPTEALQFYQAALALRPRHTFVLSHMAGAYNRRRDWPESITLFHEALAAEPTSVGLRNELAGTLEESGNVEGSLVLLRENARLRPDHAGVLCSLGVGLQRAGHLVEGLEVLRRGRQLAHEKGLHFRAQADQWLADAERLAAFDLRLTAGKTSPATAADSLGFAQVSFFKTHYAAAADFSQRAFAQDAGLAADLDAANRYQAACAAALAAAGEGEGTPSLDTLRKAALRKQALSWLREDLTAWSQRAQDPAAWPAVEAMLRLWQRHPYLASLREPAELAHLSPDEQRACKHLWDDVLALRRKVQEDR